MSLYALAFLAGVGAGQITLVAVALIRGLFRRHRKRRAPLQYLTPRLVTENSGSKSALSKAYWTRNSL
jgi:hypothetical protein